MGRGLLPLRADGDLAPSYSPADVKRQCFNGTEFGRLTVTIGGRERPRPVGADPGAGRPAFHPPGVAVRAHEPAVIGGVSVASVAGYADHFHHADGDLDRIQDADRVRIRDPRLSDGA